MSDDIWRNALSGLAGYTPDPMKPQGLLDLGALSSALLGQAPPPPSPLNGLLALGAQAMPPPAPLPVNALASALLAGAPASPPGTMTGNLFGFGWPNFPTPAPAPAPKPPRPAPRRHVFFSFHFQSDIYRVNQVRNSWRIRPEDHVPGFFDRSLWERTKRTDEAALKRMIRRGLKGTSVTCVLAGEHTWARPWVRYEIAESVLQGNGLLTVDINELKCARSRLACVQGPNPLDQMAVYRADDGRAYICEWSGQGWVQYDRLKDAVTWPAYLPDRGTLYDPHLLSLGARRYAYRSGNGYVNLTRWVREAAQAARRR